MTVKTIVIREADDNYDIYGVYHVPAGKTPEQVFDEATKDEESNARDWLEYTEHEVEIVVDL